MIVTTTDSVEGRQVAAYLGVVSGETVYGANVFRDVQTTVLSDSEATRAAILAAMDQRLHVFLGTKAQYIKTAPLLRLLDARGVISVTERQSYILRVRELAKACGAAWLKTEGGRAAA